ncbi:hypothetical protein [Actinocorallia aurantiaca]|uniref:Uncharacterized protein n=1 Tax=Actinocorallia aurantiaca TaxID=46204 RepID=A0ABP6GKC2_9ACTN
MRTLPSGIPFTAALGAASLLAVFNAGAPATAAPPPPGYRTDQVLATAVHPTLGGISIRRGFWDGDTDKGWGYDKVRHKHNIHSIYAQKRVLMSPNIEQQGTSYVLRAWAGRYRCSGSACRLVEQREVKGVFTNAHMTTLHGWPVNGVLGLQTMYCVNPQSAPQCPDWVVPAIERPGTPTGVSPRSTPGHDARNGVTLRTAYKPLPRTMTRRTGSVR